MKKNKPITPEEAIAFLDPTKPRVKYERVDTSTIEGIKKAEALHAAGYKAGPGFWIIDFYKVEEK